MIKNAASAENAKVIMVGGRKLVKSNENLKVFAKKRFGQHFLRDRGILGRLLRLINPQTGDVILEIGAGHGALSKMIAPEVSRLLTVEVDPDCLPLLEETLAPYPSALILAGDILKLDLSEILPPYLAPGQRLRIAGNLPYNIATPIIENLLTLRIPVSDMTFLVQLEVAQRIIARPRTPEYGYFSVLCQHLAAVEMGFKVSPECFTPRPKIVSAVVSLRPRGQRWGTDLEAAFRQLTKAAFGHRRKTLANSLRQASQFGASAEELLNEAGIDGTRRAEELSVEEYELLAEVSEKNLSNQN